MSSTGADCGEPKTQSSEALGVAPDPHLQQLIIGVEKASPAKAIALLRGLTSRQRFSAIALLPEKTIRALLLQMFPSSKTKLAPWSSLRSLGNFALFKISYVALLLLPWVSRIAEYLRTDGYTYFYIGAIYFGDLFLALANLVYDIRCPAVVKRWESPNDFYIKMLEVSSKQQQCYPQDAWVGDLEHSKQAYLQFAYSRPVSRLVCMLLYAFGLILLSYVTADRSWHVLRPILIPQDR